MKSECDVVNQFDACVKKYLTRELKFRTRTMQRQMKKQISISDLSNSDLSSLAYLDKYPSELFSEKLVTRLFDVVIHDELLYDALLSIKPKSRELIILKYWGDLTDVEVGQVLNMNKASVNKNKIRTLQKLRKRIEELKKE